MEVKRRSGRACAGIERFAPKGNGGKADFGGWLDVRGRAVKGKPNGYGKRTFPSGDVFEGLFKNGVAHGYGSRLYQSDEEIDRYSGLWASGKKEGFGTLIYSDSSRMEGHWESDELLYGEYQGSDGVILTGKWKKSVLSEGKMKTEFNEEFTGTFNPDGSFAKGTFLASGGDRYTGHFVANSYHGSGVLEQNDGSLYVGSFAEGLFAGVGVWVKPSGSTYSGTFKNGLPDGFGTQQDVTGVTYSGMWSEGVKKGEATLILEMERALAENSTRAWPFVDPTTGGMVGLLILIKMKTGIGGTGSSIRPLAAHRFEDCQVPTFCNKLPQ